MAITLKMDGKADWEWISDDGESRVWGKKPTVQERERIRKRLTKRGRVDDAELGIQLLTGAIDGWEGFKTPDGADVLPGDGATEPFVRTLSEQAVDVIVEIMDRVNAPEYGEQGVDPPT